MTRLGERDRGNGGDVLRVDRGGRRKVHPLHHVARTNLLRPHERIARERAGAKNRRRNSALLHLLLERTVAFANRVTFDQRLGAERRDEYESRKVRRLRRLQEVRRHRGIFGHVDQQKCTLHAVEQSLEGGGIGQIPDPYVYRRRQTGLVPIARHGAHGEIEQHLNQLTPYVAGGAGHQNHQNTSGSSNGRLSCSVLEQSSPAARQVGGAPLYDKGSIMGAD